MHPYRGEWGSKACLPGTRREIDERNAPKEPDIVGGLEVERVCCLLLCTIGHLPPRLPALFPNPQIQGRQALTLCVAACRARQHHTPDLAVAAVRETLDQKSPQDPIENGWKPSEIPWSAGVKHKQAGVNSALDPEVVKTGHR